MDCIERLDETTERIYSTFESTSMPNLKPPGRNALTTVIITQVPFGMDEEMLEAIIDNPSRGIKMEGTIKSMEIDEKSSVAVVCFSSSSDALTLLQRELLEYQQHTMHVKEPDLDNVTSVRITKVPVDMDEDILEAIIDNPSRGIKMEGTIKSMEIDDESSVAIVCFSSSSDAQKLLRRGFLEYGQQRMMVKEPARPHPAAVLVTGINNTLDQETFKIFFSSPRKTCGDEIAEIKHFEPEHGFAVIIYTRETVAEAVIRKKIHNVRQTELHAVQWIPGDEQKLRDTKAPSCRGATPDSSKDFALHSRKTHHDQSGQAKLHASFKSSEDVCMTPCSSREFEQKNEKVGEEDCDGENKDRKAGDENEEEEEVKSCTILVEGISSQLKDETIRRFFQSGSKSGGGTIESMSLVGDGAFIIVFKNHASVESVLKRKDLALDNKLITVKELTSPPSDTGHVQGTTEPLMIFIHGDLSRLTRDSLVLFLEDVTESEVRDIIYGTKDGVALAKFKAKFDYKALRREVLRKPVEDVMLGVSRVTRSSTVQVHFVKPQSEFLMKMYFESTKQSGGSGEVQVERIGECVHLIHFENPTIAQTVAEKKQCFDDEELKVAIYYESLGLIPPGYDTSRPLAQIPTEKTIKVHPLLAKYIKERKVAESVDEMLKTQKGHMDIFHPIADEVKIICDLKNDMDQVQSLAKLWEDDISDAMQNILQKFAHESINCLPTLWQDTYDLVQVYKRNELTTNVMIEEHTDCHSIEIVGPAKDVQDVLTDLNQIYHEVQESQYVMKEVMTVSLSKLEVLQKMGIEKEIKRESPKLIVQFHRKDEKIILEGKATDIVYAIRCISMHLEDITEYSMSLTKMQIAMMSSKQGWKHIKGLLNEKEVNVAIEFDTGVIIIIGTETEIEKAVTALKHEVIKDVVPISEEYRPALNCEAWNQFVQKCLNTSDGKLQVERSPDLTSITVVTVVNQLLQFKEHLTNYLETNRVKRTLIPAPPSYTRLLSRYFDKYMKPIEVNNHHFSVEIQPLQGAANNQDFGFIVSGISRGFDFAAKQVEKLIMSVVSESQTVHQPGLSKYLMSEGSKMILQGVENMCEVVIEVHDTVSKNSVGRTLPKPRQKGKPELKILDQVKLESGITIMVMVGDVTEHRVDAVVTSTDKRLQHSDGLAGALAMKGGWSIHQDSKEYIKTHGPLQAGEAMVTSAGKLPCKAIIFTVAPHWEGRVWEEADFLYDCVRHCLQVAQRENLRSVAFPAIGAELSGVPPKLATKTIVEAVIEYLRKENGCQIKEIHLVTDNQDTSQCFVNALQNVCETTKKKSTGPGPIKGTSISTGPAVETVKHSGTLTTEKGINILLIKGLIAEQKVNAIVNSVGTDLRMATGNLSNSILSALDVANKKLVQDELSQPESVVGDIRITKAGNLPCHYIFHIILPNWDNDPSKLQGALDKILSEAHDREFTSLAIPAVGTGVLQWPPKVVAETFFGSVMKFSKSIRKTRLKTIYFVLFPKDSKSIEGFEDQMRKLGGQVLTERQPTRRIAVSQEVEEPVLTGAAGGLEHIGKGQNDSEVGELVIGKVKLHVTTGDITRETTDAIVNSSNADLDVSFGRVSQALAKAAGEDFVKECMRSGGVRNDEVKVTGAGNLRCKKVIHFDARGVYGGWKTIIMKCLNEADSLGMCSVAFPALGTGIVNERPEDMADCMMEAIAEFANSNARHVRLVRVVIFEQDRRLILQPYINRMQELSSERPSWWGRFKKFIGYGEGISGKPGRLPVNSSSVDGKYPQAQRSYEQVSLEMCAFNEQSITAAFEAIDKLWADQKADQFIGGTSETNLRDLIKKLNDVQIKQIESKGAGYDVSVIVDTRRKAAPIRIQGQLKDVSSVESQIRSYLQTIAFKEHEKQEAELLCQFVQWEYKDKDGVFVPYPKEMNSKLERAYAKKEDKVSWVEEMDNGENKQYIFDLVSCVETDGNERTEMRRIDLAKKAGYDLPETWSRMDQEDKCIRVILKNTDQEYIDVAKAFQQTAPQKTILQIERIQNQTLYHGFSVLKKNMATQKSNSAEMERKLWHGTDSKIIQKICTNGFNRSYNGANGVYYGKGVYFAMNAKFSLDYCEKDDNGQFYMFYANVLTGEFCKGVPTMLEPPPKDPAKPTILYNSTVNDVTNPTVFVVYLDNQAYPNYVVTFK